MIRREPMEENILGLVRQYAASMLKKGKKVSSKRQCEYKEINTTELQKQSRQLTSEKMKLYDDYKDGRIDRDSYKQSSHVMPLVWRNLTEHLFMRDRIRQRRFIHSGEHCSIITEARW